MFVLVDKNRPTVVALYNAILHSKEDRLRGLGNTFLFDITHGLSCRVALIILVQLDGNIYLYLGALMVGALVRAGQALVVLEGI